MRFNVLFPIAFSLALGLEGCVWTPSQCTTGKYQKSAAPGRSSSLSVLSEQEKKYLDEIDVLLRTMSLEELVEVAMLDAEDAEDHSTAMAEKAAHIHQSWSALPLQEVRTLVSTEMHKILPAWKNKESSFILCEFLNAGEKMKTLTKAKVRRYTALYRALLMEYMAYLRQHGH